MNETTKQHIQRFLSIPHKPKKYSLEIKEYDNQEAEIILMFMQQQLTKTQDKKLQESVIHKHI